MLPESLPLQRPYVTKDSNFVFAKGLIFTLNTISDCFFISFCKVDLIFANDLDTLPAAFWLPKFVEKK
jgi:hypothetical protein